MSGQAQTDWIKWTPGECPIHPSDMVEIQVQEPWEKRPRKLFTRSAWANDWYALNMVAYRVVLPAASLARQQSEGAGL